MRYILILNLLISIYCQGQSISGTINTEDNNGNSATYIYFKELSQPNIIKEYITSDKTSFTHTLKKKYKNLLIEFTANGYKKDSLILINIKKEKKYNIDITLLKENIESLKEIIIKTKRRIVAKKDTVAYDVSKFADEFDRKIEDVLKKMPGIEVNEQTGAIKYNGKPVEAVTLDGDNLFGYNYTLGTKNINLDIVEKVEAINNYSENPLLKNIESSDKVSLNLKLKEGKTSVTGSLEGGIGGNHATQLETENQINLLSISKKNKTFGILSQNTIGKNNSPYGNYSEDINFNPANNKDLFAKQFINKPTINSPLENDLVYDNNLFYGSVFNLHKFKKNIVLKTSAFYLRDVVNYSQIIGTENSTQNSSINTIDAEKINNRPDYLNGVIKLEYNTSKSSFLEISSSIRYNTEATKTNTLANQTNPFLGSLNTTNFHINNSLDFTKKINDKQAYNFKINQAYNRLPQSLEILNLNSNSDNFLQESTNKNNLIDASFNFLGKKNRFKYSISVTQSFRKNNHFSTTTLEQGNVANLNQPTYQKNYSIFNGSIDYKWRQWNFINAIKYNYLTQNLENMSNNSLGSLKAIDQFVNINTKTIYNFNDYTTIEIGFEKLKETTVDNFIFDNAIFTNQRLQIENNPSLDLQNKNYFFIKHQNLIPQSRIGYDVSASYSINKGYFVPRYNVSQNNTIITNEFFNEDYTNFNISKNINKYISFLKSTLKYKLGYSKYYFNNFFNSSQIRKNESDKLENRVSLLSSFRGKLNFENRIQLDYFSNNSDFSPEINNTQFSNNLKLKYQPVKSLKILLENKWYIPNTRAFDTNFLFSNIALIYTPKRGRKTFKFKANNIFNVTDFTVIETSDFSVNTISNTLVPSYFLTSFSYDF